MDKFKIGNTYRILDNADARAWNLHTLGLIGEEFVVDEEAMSYGDMGTHAFAHFGACGARWWVTPQACELVEAVPSRMTPFQRVSEMNEAFGNPKGDFQNVDWSRVRSQCKNIFDEYCELLTALGWHPIVTSSLRSRHDTLVGGFQPVKPVEFDDVRDALADIQVFKDGALHMMGIDGDRDMHAVVDGVMTRFIKDDADKEATLALHAAKGVTQVYFEGEYPKMVMKSAVDQPDAPKGKFLKSASYKNTKFYDPSYDV